MTKQEIEKALRRLGMLANRQGIELKLFMVGGSALALGFNLRDSTRDVDALILEPSEHESVKAIIEKVGQEMHLRPNWLNDDSRIYVTQVSDGPVIFKTTGLQARRASTAQLLAMKLSASRDTQDDEDAKALLKQMRKDHPEHTMAHVWDLILPYIPYMTGLESQAKALLEVFWLREDYHDAN